jgi:hypothetical protein
MLSVYAEKFGHARAKYVTGTLPQRPLKGRWGAVTKAESALKKAGRAELLFVFYHAIVKKTGGGGSGKGKGKSAKGKLRGR